MRLTTKGRFAVTAMADMANQDLSKPVPLMDISGRQNISLSYLEQLFSKLRRKNLVVSVRGPGGGYRLSKKPVDISLAEIMSAVDEKIDATQCGGKKNCKLEDKCLTHDVWTGLNKQIFKYLDGITLGTFASVRHSGVRGKAPGKQLDSINAPKTFNIRPEK
tara:strand:- start:27 stop:512 length:486 start_codon:yes stop_codon:yes gene_type:complete